MMMIKFYINHVECEFDLMGLGVFVTSPFYINHVECELNEFFCLDEPNLRFILTMWNVNY